MVMIKKNLFNKQLIKLLWVIGLLYCPSAVCFVNGTYIAPTTMKWVDSDHLQITWGKKTGVLTYNTSWGMNYIRTYYGWAGTSPQLLETYSYQNQSLNYNASVVMAGWNSAMNGVTKTYNIQYIKGACIFYMYRSPYNSSTSQGGTDTLLTISGNTCGADSAIPPEPPIAAWCAPDISSLTFSFGSMPSASAPGAYKELSLPIFCSGSTKYYLKLASGASIDLGNGLSVNLNYGGSGLGTTFTGSSGTNTNILKATLSGTPTKTGAFSGSGILLIGYP